MVPGELYRTSSSAQSYVINEAETWNTYQRVRWYQKQTEDQCRRNTESKMAKYRVWNERGHLGCIVQTEHVVIVYRRCGHSDMPQATLTDLLVIVSHSANDVYRENSAFGIPFVI